MKTLKDRVAVVTGAGRCSHRRGVLKNKLRVRVGRDAMVPDWLEGLLPVAIHRPMAWLAKKQVAAPALPREPGQGGES